MIYAVRDAAGRWTGTAYDAVTPAITAHHATYSETVEPVGTLAEIDGVWTTTPLTLAAERAQMRASRFQARAALHKAGLLAGIEAAVAQADPIVQIAWADAAEWRRDSPALIALAGAVGLSDEDIDALFRAAMQIVA